MFKFNFPGQWSNSAYTGVYYVHSYPSPKEKDLLVPNESVNSCREFFVREYRHKIAKQNSDAIAIRKACVVISFGKPQKHLYKLWLSDLIEAAEKGVYILNSFEREHKWPLTKVYPVDSNENIPLVFFTGARKWTMSPYLLSIWSLCVRLGSNSWLPKNLMTLDHENLVRQMAIASKNQANTDAIQLSQTIRHWDPFMTLYPDLFGQNNRKYHWKLDHLNGGADRPEGIQKLITGNTYYKALHKEYYRLKEEKKLK